MTGKASTRELILDTAERLFAEQGIFATSNRRIAEAAGQGNNWVAGYHFGSKADLVRAITRRFTAEVERSRTQMLADLDDSAGLEELLGCLVRPWTDRFEALGPKSYFARVCAQAMNSPTLRPIVVEEGSHSDSVEQTWEALDKYLPGPADLSTELRRGMMQHLIVFVCAEREGALAEGRPVSRATWADEANGLIDALLGIITASMTDLTPSPARRRPYGRVT
jgi:AcrR family transcriptional regulator